MTVRELESKVDLLAVLVRRLESAVAELAGETHAVSTTEQIAAKGLPALARVMCDHRNGRFETSTPIPQETR